MLGVGGGAATPVVLRGAFAVAEVSAVEGGPPSSLSDSSSHESATVAFLDFCCLFAEAGSTDSLVLDAIVAAEFELLTKLREAAEDWIVRDFGTRFKTRGFRRAPQQRNCKDMSSRT